MNTAGPARSRYSQVAIALHWIIAILIVLNFLGAWQAEDLKGAEKAWVMDGHKAMGILILTLSVLRLVWRFLNPPPPLLDSLKAWEVALAKVTHGLFYLVIIAVPLAGWAMHSAFTGGASFTFFGLFDLPGLPLDKSKDTAGLFYELHETFAAVMLGLIVLHIAGALKHVVIDRDGTLRRILPWG